MALTVTEEDMAEALSHETAFKAAKEKNPHLTKLYMRAATRAVNAPSKGRE